MLKANNFVCNRKIPWNLNRLIIHYLHYFHSQSSDSHPLEHVCILKNAENQRKVILAPSWRARNVQHVNIKQFNSQFGCSTSKHPGCYNRELKARLHEYTTSDTVSLRTEYLVAKNSGSNESFEVSKITRKGRYALMDCYFELHGYCW